MRVIATVVGGAATRDLRCGWNGQQQNAIKGNFQVLLGERNFSKGVVVKTTEAGTIAVDVYTVLSYGTKISEVSKKYSRP